MKELIFNFHGVGAVPSAVDRAEAAVWWDEAPFLRALDEIAASAPKFEYPIALTFDDGNASDVEIALPALIKRGLKATFFVCAGRVGTANYLDAVGIDNLLRAGMTVGSHGMNYVDWRVASDRDLDNEIEGARMRLEDICGKAIDVAALPFGSYDRRVIRRLKRANWRCVYSSDGGLARADAWFKPRETLREAPKGQDLIPQMRAKDTLRKALWRRLAGLLKRCR